MFALTPASPANKILPLHASPSPTSNHQKHLTQTIEADQRSAAFTGAVENGRRQILLFGGALAGSGFLHEVLLGRGEAVEELQTYRDPSDRFEITVPAMWIQSEKPGAQVLFKSAQKSSSTLGITINPVKIPSLQIFGTVEEIGSRLLNAERQKDGFIDIKLLEQRSRSDDRPFNVYVYDLETTRGKKHVVTGVTIEGFRLFIVNGACKIDDVEDGRRLEQSVNSFQLL